MSQVLCRRDELAEGQAREVSTATGEDLIVLRHRGELRAYRNRCPHTGVGLNWLPDDFLTDDGEFIRCASHGALFRLEDGFCVYGPCRGQSLLPVAVIEQGEDLLLAE